MTKRSIISVLVALGVLAGGVSSFAASGPEEITLWYTKGGPNGQTIGKIVSAFNDGEGKARNVVVKTIYQGSYDDIMKKLRAAVQSKNLKSLPDIVQLAASDIGYAKDVPATIWAEDLFKMDKELDRSTFLPNALSAFSYQGKCVGVPVATSTIILYYNKDQFKEVGLDPNKPPVTIKELGEYAGKLYKANGNTVERYGFSCSPYAWHMASWIGGQGKDCSYIGDNENGRANNMTKVIFDANGTMKRFLEVYKEAATTGKFQNIEQNKKSEFAAGRISMMVDSTASITSMLNSINGKFQLGIGYFPKVGPQDEGGVSVGGSGFFVMDRKQPEKIKDIVEFLKFWCQPEQQMLWHQETGYFPISLKTFDDPTFKQYLQTNPYYTTAIAQLRSSNPKIQEPMYAIENDFSKALTDNILDVLENKKDIDTAVRDMARSCNAALDTYNRANH